MIIYIKLLDNISEQVKFEVGESIIRIIRRIN